MASLSQKKLTTCFNKKILSIFFLGFSSGLPFLLTLSTLSIWLKESGVNNTTIGLFVLATVPYIFKFLWGPIVDQVKIPILNRFLGQRRSWALVAQIALIVMLTRLGASHPQSSIGEMLFWAFAVSFFSAIQDIVIEAYRIEIIDGNQKGIAASAIVLGWRFGMMAAGAGALFLAETYSWQYAYNFMAFLMLVGVFTTLLSPSPKELVFSPAPHLSLKSKPYPHFWQWIVLTYGPPFRELCHVYDWRIVVAFIFLYKIGDTALSVMNNPFLVELGFSKIEIAHVAKLFGISAMIVGGFIGGFCLDRFGVFSSLMLCAILQFFSSLMFIVQAVVGHNFNVLVLTIGIENFTSGLCATAFIAYLSSLCSIPHTATHFAILSSFGSFTRIILSITSGVLADVVSWPLFFAITSIGCLPCFFLLFFAQNHFSYENIFLRKMTKN